MRIMYVACDGEEFDNEIECLNYERTLTQRWHGLGDFTYFDSTGREIPFWIDDNTDEEVIEPLLNSAYFIIMRRNLTDEEIAYIEGEYGFEIPHERGIWRYDDNKQVWFEFEQEKKEFFSNWPATVVKTIND